MTQRTVDVTPTWAQAMEMLLLVLENGTEEGKEGARKELRRLAREVDRVNAR